MRLQRFIHAVRDLHESARVNATFVRRVMVQANRIASDIAADLPRGPALVQRIEQILARIEQECAADGVLLIDRAELRGRSELHNLGSVGCHWAWEANAATVYHHDNAYDDAERNGIGRNELVDFRMTGEVAPKDVDWPYTVATNLIHPGECEVTVLNGARIKVVDIAGKDFHESGEQIVVASGYYQVK